MCSISLVGSLNFAEMSRQPRGRWNQQGRPFDPRFDYHFDDQAPLGYDGNQEPPYPFPNGHDYYFPGARDEFGYRERSPLRRYDNPPPGPYQYEHLPPQQNANAPYDHANFYREQPGYDPRSYPTHDDFEPGYEDDQPTEEYSLDDWEDEEEGQVVSGRSWLPINTDSRPVAKTRGGKTGGTTSKGASTSGAGPSGATANKAARG